MNKELELAARNAIQALKEYNQALQMVKQEMDMTALLLIEKITNEVENEPDRGPDDNEAFRGKTEEA